MIRVSILLITVAFLITAALIAGIGGCVARPIEIRDWYDLNDIRDNLEGSYLLMNDLDSTNPGYEELASETANQGKGWQPIAIFHPWAASSFTGFEGTFDGQGYEIRDLFINRPDELGVGLFSEIGREGVIKDTGVANSTLNGNGWMGLFAVVDEGGRIENISLVSATVTGKDFVGGLVGVNGGTVSNSYSTASVTGNDYVGCLVGESWGFGTVIKSYSTGSATGNYNVGGLVGVNGGTVSNSYSTASVTGNSSIGGLVGENERGTVSNSFWDTEISGQVISAGGTGKTTAEMQDIATFTAAGWGISAVVNANTRNSSYIWNIVDNEIYPFLSWQPVV
jgi:hypothetical protein